jgi:hypothetical protein
VLLKTERQNFKRPKIERPFKCTLSQKVYIEKPHNRTGHNKKKPNIERLPPIGKKVRKQKPPKIK